MSSTLGVAVNMMRQWPFTCYVCLRRFYTMTSYLSHVIRHNDRINCPICYKGFQLVPDMREHYYQHTPCFKCGERKRQLIEVKKFTSERKELGVKFCEDCFVKMEQGEFICYKCGTVFSTVDLIKRHELEHNNIAEDEAAT